MSTSTPHQHSNQPHHSQPADKLRRRLFHILHNPSPSNPTARYVNYLLAALIVCNCSAVALGTIPELKQAYRREFFIFELVSTLIFSLEYALRVWVCVEQEKFSHSMRGRVRYMLTALPLLDLIVVLSFLLPVDLRFLRIFRISRLLRVLNLGNFDQSLQAVLHAIARRRTMLLVSIFMMLIAIYFAASALYIIEHAAQPDKFTSIPATLWWALITLTTIGYGDLYPITPLGKFIASIISIIGIGIFALPTAILTAAILDGSNHASHSEEPTAANTATKHKHCHHCGGKLD